MIYEFKYEFKACMEAALKLDSLYYRVAKNTHILCNLFALRDLTFTANNVFGPKQ